VDIRRFTIEFVIQPVLLGCWI